MSTRDKWVRRFSVDETAKHKSGFTIYKITSVLFPIDSPEAVTVVSVWKRYSDIQQLHKSMKTLHAGLYLRGTFPPLAKSSFFKRFQQEVIEERAKSIKELLEFVAEHKLLFTSTDFVNFLQSGYPDPEPKGVINAIRSSLQLPIEDAPPLEYQTSDDDTKSPESKKLYICKLYNYTGYFFIYKNLQSSTTSPVHSSIPTDISQIPIYEAADVELRVSSRKTDSNSNSFESLNSLDSISSDLYDELSKVTINKIKPLVRKNVLPDLINFDAPSTSKFDDYHTMPKRFDGSSVDTMSINSSMMSEVDGVVKESRNLSISQNTETMSKYDTSSLRSIGFDRTRRSSSYSVLSLSGMECKTKTEDSYVFEAGYLLNLAARSEDLGEYQRAFEFYKSGIEKMLIGVQSDSDPERRALIKEKTNKYLSYAEDIYKNHLSGAEQSLLPEREIDTPKSIHCGIPLSMLRRPYEELAMYRVLAVLGNTMMLVLHKTEQTCYAMKVIQKVPQNLTEFDNYFQRTHDTREPILPTLIPYMVPLHAYIDTNNLIFLILSYAPGQKLFDYIKNYAKSVPNTPRRVNLENVFPKETHSENNVPTDVNRNEELSVKELVTSSQKLLLDVDKALTEKGDSDVKNENRDVPSPSVKLSKSPRDVLPPSTICMWGAEILTALESLHNAGVICRDLNPSNVLLSDGGQIILTYFIHHSGMDMALSQIRRSPWSIYIAPELYTHVYMEEDGLDKVCDYWSFGAIVYELICGVPLSEYHKSTFTSHTILQLPEGLSVEVESLLTQLLTYEPSERLGGGKDGINEIKEHPYFKHIDWQHVYNNWIVPD
ncbi:ribosomal protein S6 kinase-like 1 isoform X1 [Pieris napi]|uniref:ribosomal protein S6 kinase-like 1 isoform X1 n=1 Tax=Pieris napi TaxID=78633 RepID=UPI001FB8E4A2|nr:ribosomal protein S6 kinase-like 1 isoform X1 [Pieris napi]